MSIRVKVLKTFQGSNDGIKVILFKVGETHDISEALFECIKNDNVVELDSKADKQPFQSTLKISLKQATPRRGRPKKDDK